MFVFDAGSHGIKSLVVQRNGNIIGFNDAGELHVHGLYDGHRRDVVFLVVVDLLGAAAVGFIDGLIHGIGAAVGVENGAAFDVASAAADRLNKRSGAAEVAFFVGVKDGDERNLGQI